MDAVLTLGNSVLRSSGYAPLRGHRVACLTNPTGIFADTFEHIVDAMHHDLPTQADASLVLVLSPEHGFRGDHQAEHGDAQPFNDSVTGLPVYPAYSMSDDNVRQLLASANVSAVVVDMQDAGVRLYTFVWTMHAVMRAASKVRPRQPRLVVLDRPNPLGGEVVSGPLLNTSCCSSGYGRAPIPHQHGMTIGELATLFAAQLDAPALVSVVRMSGWARSMRWGDTGLAWVPPSPNLPTLASNDAYVASVFLEATTASEGRGTTLPFTLVGAPWLNATALSSILNDAACSTDDMRGELAAPSQPCTAAVRAAWFTPTWFKHNGTVCEGVQWVRVAHPAFPTFADGMRILTAVRDLAPPGALRYDGSWFGHPGADLLDWYAGTRRVRELLQAGAAWQAIVTTFEPDAAAFRTTRAPFLLYSESDSRRDGHSGGHSTGCWEKRAVEERQEAALAKAAAARERGDAARAQSAASAGAWADVQRVLEDGVAAHAFPGAVALVGGREGTLFASAVGAHTYEAHATRMAVESSLFDVASLTKVTATTTAAMLLYQWGELDLGTRLVEWFGAAFAHADARKARMSVLHLLTHTAGWPPDPTPVSYCAPSFRCPQTDKPPQRRKLSFACRPRIVQQLYTQTLAAEPGAAYVYSDLSMITLMWAVGRLARRHVSPSELSPSCAALSTARPPAAPAAGQREAAARVGSGITAIEGVDQCYYEAFVRRYVLSRLAPSGGGTALPPFVGFRPAAAYWPLAAPTWNDTSEGFPGECVSPFRERLLQGEVSDGNAYAMGGIAGHAGLFATAPALLALLRAVAFAPAQPSPSSLGVNATTAATFTTVHNASVSSRALGWDTNAPGSYLGCGNWSAATFTHTGYTGTMLCADAAGGLLAVLLTNRVYPRADARSASAIHRVRQRFSDAVLRAAQSIHRPPSTI